VWTGCIRVLLQRLADAGRIDWSRASADAARVPAKGGGRPVRARDTVRKQAAITRLQVRRLESTCGLPTPRGPLGVWARELVKHRRSRRPVDKYTGPRHCQQRCRPTHLIDTFAAPLGDAL